jgi:hypothetical protein
MTDLPVGLLLLNGVEAFANASPDKLSIVHDLPF